MQEISGGSCIPNCIFPDASKRHNGCIILTLDTKMFQYLVNCTLNQSSSLCEQFTFKSAPRSVHVHCPYGKKVSEKLFLLKVAACRSKEESIPNGIVPQNQIPDVQNVLGLSHKHAKKGILKNVQSDSPRSIFLRGLGLFILFGFNLAQRRLLVAFEPWAFDECSCSCILAERLHNRSAEQTCSLCHGRAKKSFWTTCLTLAGTPFVCGQNPCIISREAFATARDVMPRLCRTVVGSRYGTLRYYTTSRGFDNIPYGLPQHATKTITLENTKNQIQGWVSGNICKCWSCHNY